MLHFLLGRAGSGKTYSAKKLLKDFVEQGREKLLLLVPEQYSYESEREILNLLGVKQSNFVKVFSFAKLCEDTFQQFGGFAGKRLNDSGRYLLMSMALKEVQQYLSLYSRESQTTELTKLMLQVSTEMKMCTVTPLTLSELSQKIPEGTLQKKIKEISLILSAYQALVQQSYLDPQDDLSRLKEFLKNNSIFAGFTIVVDSFKGFTVQELDILELLLCQAEDIYFTFCTDTLQDFENGIGLFSGVKHTAAQISRLARKHSVPIAAPILLPEGMRFQKEGLSFLEVNIFRENKVKFPKADGAITLYCAENVYEEAEFVAASIRNLVMSSGYRYRDFAIIVRSLENYIGNLDMALQRWEIPCFMDLPQSIEAEPLMHFVLNAFKIVRFGFRSDDIFSYLKTGLCGFTTEEISLLENYTFLWKINGKKWRECWTENPQGFVQNVTEQQMEQLKLLNSLREKITQPLITFSERIRETNGEEIAKAVFLLLEEVQVAKHLKQLYFNLKEYGKLGEAEEQLRLWDLLMDLLDQSALILGKKTVTPTRYAELLKLMISAGSIASIPQELDQVTVGVADRIRPHEPKVVFLLGVCEGEFPLTSSSGGVFSEEERATLIQLGLPLSETLEGKAVEERFLSYSAMTSPSEHLYLSFPACSMTGESKSPSVMVNQIRRLFPDLVVKNRKDFPIDYFANSLEPAFELAARLWQTNTQESETLKEFFREKEDFFRRLSFLKRAAEKIPASIENPKVARAIFEKGKHLSATQVETYHLCHFRYFCRYTLKAQERIPAELNAMEYGSLMHYLLEHLLKEEGSQKIAQMGSVQLKEEIRKNIACYAAEKMGGKENKTPRFLFLLDRISEAAQIILSHIAQELNQSEFSPVAYELELGEEDRFPPLKIKLPSGETITVEGKIDRIDVMEKEGVSYVRIIDYKTGKKEFKLHDILYGVNMQMLIYLAAIIESGNFRPGGILYMPATQPTVLAQRGDSVEITQKSVEKSLKMNGLLVGEEEILTGMEADMSGKYIPAAMKNGKITGGDSVVSSYEMDRILDYAKYSIAQMAEDLLNGEIAARPLKGEYDACSYCPYFSICGYEEKEEGVLGIRQDKEEVLNTLQKELKEGRGKDG